MDDQVGLMMKQQLADLENDESKEIAMDNNLQVEKKPSSYASKNERYTTGKPRKLEQENQQFLHMIFSSEEIGVSVNNAGFVGKSKNVGPPDGRRMDT